MQIDLASGLELRHAITWFAKSDEWAKRYFTLSMRRQIKRDMPGALSAEERYLLTSCTQILAEQLVERLSAGELQARGRLAQAITRQSIPADWWRNVVLDVRQNSAEADGTVLRAVLIFEHDAAVAGSHGVKAKPGPKGGGSVVMVTKLHELMAKGITFKTTKDAYNQVIKELGHTHAIPRGYSYGVFQRATTHIPFF